MADNVIRRDVIQLELESDALKEVQKLTKELDELKRKFGLLDDDPTEKAENGIRKTRSEADKTTRSVGKLGTALKTVAKVSFKALAIGIGSAATAIGKVTYDATQAYSEFEQLDGGMKKIFDKANTSGIMKDANNAYKTLGMSANDYLRVINDTGATFAAVMGDQKGYNTAKTGLTAISDYATGTGKDINELSEKFTLITRSTSSYQSIADQFSGILPATSKDFLAQAQAAGLLSKKYSKLTDVPVAEYQETVAKMLEKGVAGLGLAGNAAAEAEKTFSGSFGMMKAAWGNLLIAIGSGKGLDQCFDNMINAATKFGDNLMPVLERSLIGIGTVVEKLAPKIESGLPKLIDKLLPPLLSAATSLLSAVIKSFPSIIKALINEMPDILKQIGQALGETFGIKLPWLDSLGNFFEKNGDKIKKAIPTIAGIAGALLLFSKLKGIGSIFSGMFGGSGGAGKGGLFSGIAELGKTNAGLLAKGMANIAMVIGGFTAIGATFALVAPHIAKLSDVKSLAEVAAIVTVLGAIGTVMAKFAGIVGTIPVSTVAKGLANMAIMIGGLTAIGAAFAWVAPYIANLADNKSLIKVATIITVLGTIGTVMSVFAGIAGIIPIPVVLAGLANIALVIGGLTAIVVAFGALSKIPGFNEFITTGGETLANLFGQIGKIAGSLVGGLGEALSESLPTIGKNLASFAESIKPLFSCFKGVDLNGVGAFFSALGSFMLKMAGENILSFFTGGTDFSGVSEGLGSLAGEGVKKFFAMVKGIEEPAYTNAKLFFNALDGISKLPNVGGLGQIFTGENDFSGVATGLGVLAGAGVKNFFAMVQGMEQTAFDNAKLFFTALDGISSLPNVGGIGQVFSGENDFSGVAAGLGALSGQGVKNFFAMVSGLDEGVFAKTKTLFTTLGSIGDVGKEGFWDKVKGVFSGGEGGTSPLANMANGLSDFAEKAADFFKQINTLEVGNLNSMIEALKNLQTATTDLSETISTGFTAIVTTISTSSAAALLAITLMTTQIKTAIATTNLAPCGMQMMNSLAMGIYSSSGAILGAVRTVTGQINREINSTVNSANRKLSALGYANGTSGHRGGNAIVNDGRGAELVQMPNGNAFIPMGRNVFLPNAPKGMKVLDAENTARLFGKHAPTFNYANGTDYPRYAPSSTVTNRSTSENNTYAPVFNLTISGTNSDRTMERKVKAWVRDSMNETFRSMARKSPRLQEV